MPSDQGTPGVEVVLFRADAGGRRDALVMVSCSDGNLRILRDGHPIAGGGTWAADDLSDCIDTFQQLARGGGGAATARAS